ncbi:hypothetical protein [Methylobacterium brachythecii]|uniref:Uncharacterized protein n=2 Tax=Methylobacterium brachythecii TaxID=1176177 RepID=A0A7W6F9E8_9HYPH|nr:hypothetical protein [Methylobacterium brachythecii]MBB3905404.1 hypothetical protein [Methylobacterium brachythecii]
MTKYATAAILTAMCGSFGLSTVGVAASLPQVPTVSVSDLHPTWVKMKKKHSMKRSMKRRGGQAATPANPTPGR